MNAIDLLKNQHREVGDSIEKIARARSANSKETLFAKIQNDLAAHSAIEEKLFYPTAYAKETKDLLKEATEEHLGIKRLIADLLRMSPDDENFDAKITVLREQVEHHVTEEERELFKSARSGFGATRLKELGTQMKEMFDAEMATEPSQKVPKETKKAAPLPKTQKPSSHAHHAHR